MENYWWKLLLQLNRGLLHVHDLSILNRRIQNDQTIFPATLQKINKRKVLSKFWCYEFRDNETGNINHLSRFMIKKKTSFGDPCYSFDQITINENQARVSSRLWFENFFRVRNIILLKVPTKSNVRIKYNTSYGTVFGHPILW